MRLTGDISNLDMRLRGRWGGRLRGLQLLITISVKSHEDMSQRSCCMSQKHLQLESVSASTVMIATLYETK